MADPIEDAQKTKVPWTLREHERIKRERDDWKTSAQNLEALLETRQEDLRRARSERDGMRAQVVSFAVEKLDDSVLTEILERRKLDLSWTPRERGLNIDLQATQRERDNFRAKAERVEEMRLRVATLERESCRGHIAHESGTTVPASVALRMPTRRGP